jgi:hypothetical protein
MATLAAQKSILGTTMSVHLYNNNYLPTNQSTIADFTETAFTGYSAVTVIGTAAVAWQSQGAAVMWTSPQAVFSTASPYTVMDTIYGYYIESGTSPNYLIGAERFSAPIAMGAAGNQIIVAAPISAADGGIPGQVY